MNMTDHSAIGFEGLTKQRNVPIEFPCRAFSGSPVETSSREAGRRACVYAPYLPAKRLRSSSNFAKGCKAGKGSGPLNFAEKKR